jgi:hypothetical protein
MSSWRFTPVYVSSFSASLSPQAEQAARRALQRLGVSLLGVDQFLKGQVVTTPADRTRLASLVAVSATDGRSMSFELLAAADFNNARGFQGGCTKGDILRFGVSPPGVDQFLNGQVVVNPADRARLASLVVRGFTPPIGSNKGSLIDRIPSGGLFPAS